METDMPADTFSSILGWLVMGTGNDNNNWGDNHNNQVSAILEKAIAGWNTSAVTGGTLDLSANAPPAGPSGAVESLLQFTGTLAANQTVIVPNLTKTWWVSNALTLAGFTLSFKTPSGSPVVIPPGYQVVFCTGSN